MDKFRRDLSLFIFSLIILCPQIISTVAIQQETQSISDIVREMYDLVTTSSMNSWETVKSLVIELQSQYFPPNLDFRTRGEADSNGGGGGEDGAKEKIKEAAEKSFGASKEAVEESAKSAAGVVHKTKEKVKDCFGDACHAEL